MTYLAPSEAYQLIKEGRFNTLRKARVSQHFTWGEVFVHRSDAQIQLVKPVYLLNAYSLASRMEVVRGLCGHRPISVTSWWRDFETNQKVGGARLSRHLTADAVDFVIRGITPKQVQAKLDGLWPGGLGYGPTFTHLDQRKMKVRFNYS